MLFSLFGKINALIMILGLIIAGLSADFENYCLHKIPALPG